MKFLGIDYGTKRIGIALSDAEGRLAFPKIILKNSARVFTEIKKITEEEDVAEIVVGQSLDFKNKPNPVQAEIETFSRALQEQLKIPLHSQKEFLTSSEGRKYKNTERIDAVAAALLLQRYLDRINLL